MSAKERDRLKVLHEVRKRHITQRQAAAELGISVGGCELCSAFAGAWGRGTAASIARPVAVASIIIAVVIALAVTATDWGELSRRLRLDTNVLSAELFTDPGNLLPFEVIGVLLLAAVIGGVFLAKREPGGPP